MSNTPLALVILDGFGHREDERGNAILAASTPNIDTLCASYPLTYLRSSGLAVGLPEGQMGNSEVGHTNMGAGRIVYQDLTRISKDVKDGGFFENEALLAAVRHCQENDSAFHIMGLLSDGGVHSHIDHIEALLRLAGRHGLTRVYLHCFLDGRDVSPTSGASFVERLEQAASATQTGQIATIVGRYYAMDRDGRYERIQTAYDALVSGKGEGMSKPAAAVRASYGAGVTDEFVLPLVAESTERIAAGDAVVFANFRPDRARQLTRAFVDEEFDHFPRPGGRLPLFFVCLTEYDKTMEGVHIAYGQDDLKNVLGEVLANHGRTQLRIAETEKYAHVTFFFNGGAEEPFPGEDRALIPSPKVATYDLKPEMSAHEVTNEAVARLRSGEYDVMILNYANCDMVGHTGDFDATVEAVETVDACVGRIFEEVHRQGGVMLLTADHGNADQMLEEGSSKPFTAHTASPVLFLAAKWDGALRDSGVLADIAPTVLELLGIDPPEEMTATSLLIPEGRA